ncbi:alpha-ribazole phosphatase [Rhodoferax ferrireducens]|uniref:Alpha-ribazole phosphatase n=1 Tax=Rhodoferax ferrireducens TaxID=192843 RepID=A0ABU2CE22_9BURK|nr:histidine phosphatase family protein [Rhodoferax ferrireducens]MDR7379457.1 alpha-ribazole phosphatase [Rhodoferax ferrireducens]
MTLWAVRHAQPLVATGICYGALDLAADAPATQAAAEKLAAMLPTGCHVRSSTLQRCEQLAQVLSALRPDLMPNLDPRLREMDFGSWEGQRWDAIGQSALDAWTADFAQHRPGGGESVQGFMQRVAAAWDEKGDGPTLWITHAGVIRACSLLHAGLRQITQASQWPQAAPGYGECIFFK